MMCVLGCKVEFKNEEYCRATSVFFSKFACAIKISVCLRSVQIHLAE